MFQGKRNLFVQQRGLLTEGQFLVSAGASPPAQVQQLSQASPAPSPQALRQPESIVQHALSVGRSCGNEAPVNDHGNASPRKRLRFADEADSGGDKQATKLLTNTHNVAGTSVMHPSVRASMLRSWLISSIIARPDATESPHNVCHRFWVFAVDDQREPHAGATVQDAFASRSRASIPTKKNMSSAASAQSLVASTIAQRSQAIQAFTDEVKGHCISAPSDARPSIVVEVDVGNVQQPRPQSRHDAQVPSVETIEASMREHLAASISTCDKKQTLSVVWALRCTSINCADHLINIRAACRRLAAPTSACTTLPQPQFGAIVIQLQSLQLPSAGAPSASSSNFTRGTPGVSKSRADAPAPHIGARTSTTLLDIVCGNTAAMMFDSIVTVPILL
jgi:hypothetical protein